MTYSPAFQAYGRVAQGFSPVVLLLAVGCSSKSTPTAEATPSAEIAAFSHVHNLMPVSFSVGSTNAWGFVDTGNPVVELTPGVFPVPSNESAKEPVTLNGQTIDVLALGAPQAPVDPALALDGNLGCGVTCGHVASFNYRDVAFTLGESLPAAPSGLMSDVAVPFSFEGGNTGGPRSRIIVTVAIEGRELTMQLDTGATEVMISEAAYSAITSDGRKQLTGGSATSNGSGSSSFTRVRSVVVGGAEADSVVIGHSSDFDVTLKDDSADVGHTVDGSLGTTFLNHFFVTVDYPKNTVHFAKYEDSSFILDPAEFIGVMFGPEAGGGGYPVASLLAGSPASAQVHVGDVVTAIDGRGLATLSYPEAAALTYGPVGSTKVLQIGGTKTVSVDVAEFLPQSAAAPSDDGGAGGGFGEAGLGG